MTDAFTEHKPECPKCGAQMWVAVIWKDQKNLRKLRCKCGYEGPLLEFKK